MKYQKKQEVKKKIFAIIALLMALIMILSLIAPFTIFAAPVDQEVTAEAVGSGEQNPEESIVSLSAFGQERFDVELEVGFEESYIVRKTMPVLGVVTNRGKAFHGEIQMKAYTRENGDEKEYVIYYQKLDLEQGASKAVEMEVTMGSIHKYIDVTLVDEKGEKVFQDFVFLTAKDPNTIMTGVLSESTQDLKYLNTLQLSKVNDEYSGTTGEYLTELNRNYNYTVFLEEDTFPASIGVMNSFSVILADDFDFSALEEKQQAALQAWVISGGTLVLGTGAAAQKTLKGLDFLSDIQVAGTTTVPELAGVAGDITLAQLKGEGLSQLRGKDGQPVVSLFQVGQGKVILNHFSLSQAPMAGQGGTLNLLTQVLQEAVEDAVTVSASKGNYDGLRSMAGGFPPFEAGSVYLIFGAIAAYIIITGPLLYFVLKKKDKREKGWILIPISSLLFMVFVFILAQGSTYKNGLLNTVAVVKMQEGTSAAGADVGVAIKSSGKGDVVFTSDEKIPIDVNMDEGYYNYYGGNDGIDQCAYRILCGDTTEVTFSDSQSWSTQFFKTQQTIELGGNVESTVVMKDGKFVGEILNNTNVDFYGVTLLLDGYAQNLGSLDAGETLYVDRSIEDMMRENAYYGVYDYEEIRIQLKNGEITRKDAYLKYMQADLQQQYYDRINQNADLIPVTFLGYSDAPLLSGEKKVNGKSVLENSMTMYMQEYPLEFSVQESFEIRLSSMVEASVKFYENVTENGVQVYSFEDGDFSLRYQLPEGVRIDQMVLELPTGSALKLPDNVKLFNRKTQAWDEVTLGEALSVEAYIDENNLVKATVYCQRDSEVLIPKLWLQGGGLFVGN